jgi:hypothetical protein
MIICEIYKSTMPKLILNNNYSLLVNNYSASKFIRKFINGHYKVIKQKDGKVIFTNGKMTFTLWNNQRYRGNYTCYITLQKNNDYRITKYELNSNSIYVWIKVNLIEINYLESFVCITTLEKFMFLIDFYNKTNITHKLNRVPVIAKVFQDYYITRYISEFL